MAELSPLTPTESKVLDAACDGLNVREIATRLDIGYSTIRTHLNNIYQKRHVHSRAEMIAQEWKVRVLDGYMEARTS